MTTVHNLGQLRNRKIDWQHDPDYLYIGRANTPLNLPASLLGNPFRIDKRRPDGREQSIAQYEAYARERLGKSQKFRDAVYDCYGKRLVCYCAPMACHGDVLVRLSQELHDEEEAARLEAYLKEKAEREEQERTATYRGRIPAAEERVVEVAQWAQAKCVVIHDLPSFQVWREHCWSRVMQAHRRKVVLETLAYGGERQ